MKRIIRRESISFRGLMALSVFLLPLTVSAQSPTIQIIGESTTSPLPGTTMYVTVTVCDAFTYNSNPDTRPKVMAAIISGSGQTGLNLNCLTAGQYLAVDNNITGNIASGPGMYDPDTGNNATGFGGPPVYPNINVVANASCAANAVTAVWPIYIDGNFLTAGNYSFVAVAAEDFITCGTSPFSSDYFNFTLPSNTSTPTGTWFTSTTTNTGTPTNTPTITPTATNTPTFTFSPTGTLPPTVTSTSTFTYTPVSSYTPTGSPTYTETKTPTNTNTPGGVTNTPTSTFTYTPVSSYTPTGSPTYALTKTPTNTNTPGGVSNTPTFTFSPTGTPPPTGTFTSTFTNTITPGSPTYTPTYTTSNTPTGSATYTPTITSTSTSTNTVTGSPTYTKTSTWTVTPTSTSTFTNTYTPGSPTYTPTYTSTNTPTGSATYTPTPTTTFTSTNTSTGSATNTKTNTITNTPTSTLTPTNTQTPVGTPLAMVSQVINFSQPATVALGNGAVVSMPANTFAQPVTLTITEYSSGSAPSTATAFQLNFMPNAYTIDAGGLQPGASVTITLPYDPAQIPPGYTTADLTMTYFNGTSWVTLPVTVDTVNHLVTVVVTHFSWWAAAIKEHTLTPTPGTSAGNNGKPILFPNPATTGSVKIQLNLAGTSDVRLQIYTTSFRKVRDITLKQVLAGSDVTLDLVDKTNAILGNGLFYVIVTTNQGKSALKLLIFR